MPKFKDTYINPDPRHDLSTASDIPNARSPSIAYHWPHTLLGLCRKALNDFMKSDIRTQGANSLEAWILRPMNRQ